MPERPEPPSGGASSAVRHVLVVNQHGDNTGDEAAIRGMVNGLADQFGVVRFTVLHQFRERRSEVDTGRDITWIRLVPGPVEALRIALYSLLRVFGTPPHVLLGPVGRSIIAAYEQADVVVSAPGGPYLGDRYWSHEPLHWFYIWLARLHRVPAGLYATSAGPFRIRVMNPLRRWTYRCFDAVAVREERSAEYLRGLMGPRFELEVTADSALQERVDPADRSQWLVGEDRQPLGQRFVLVVSAIDLPYGGDPDPSGRRQRYDAAVVAGIRHVVARASAERVDAGPDGAATAHVVFMPQLHSERHSDVGYLTRLGESLGDGVSWEVIDDGRSSDEQRARFAAADLVIAGRYHPAVFAVSAGVPVVCIPYEHKAVGLMEAAGQDAFIVGLDEISAGRLISALDDLLDRRETVARELSEVEPDLRGRSRRTNELIAALVR